MRYRHQTIEFGDFDIHVRTLRDTNEFADVGGEAEALGIPPASWPLFGVLWDSAFVLAALMVRADIAGRRILEVGCGIGLASLVLSKRGADITASDRHPEAARFLAHNTQLNEVPPIPFERSDWDDPQDGPPRFDRVIGSDLLYEAQHAALLAGFIDAHATPDAEVIVVDAGRGHAGRFARQMIERGFEHTHRHAADDPSLAFGREIGARIQIHTFRRSPPTEVGS